jgi:2-polyprenyl-3-methyl-5-hydroxy-6-metoxy-1,4-benzoquinol methylase
MIDTQHNAVIGIDRVEVRRNSDKFNEFIVHDLECGLPVSRLKGRRFDYIFLLDVLEHLTDPSKVLQDLHQIADPETRIIISVPNVANIYIRLNLLFGRFEYSNRGILDRTHVRFFTKASLERWVRDNGFVIKKRLYTNIPINEVVGRRESGPLLKVVNHTLHFFTKILSGLLAYQIILDVRRKPGT